MSNLTLWIIHKYPSYPRYPSLSSILSIGRNMNLITGREKDFYEDQKMDERMSVNQRDNGKEINDCYKLNNKEKRKIYIFKRRHV